MALIRTTIDGREVRVERDSWALEVAGDMGIEIPTLCYHPALEPYGACRLCVVEVTRKGWTWLTTSCDLPIREGMSIRTDTPEVTKARRMAMELILAEAPNSETIRSLARKMGVSESRFATVRDEQDKCIRCGLCVRVCEQLVGAAAIGFKNRGQKREVGTPFDDLSEACIGCMACVAVCPTGHVLSIDDGALRRMESWNTELELAQCSRCGRPFAPLRELEFIRAKLPEHMAPGEVCPVCKRRFSAEQMSPTTTASKHSPT